MQVPASGRRSIISLLPSSGAGLHQDRSGGTHAQFDALGYFIQADAHRHPLRQADPREGRIDVRQQFETGGTVLLRDTPAEAVDHPFKRLVRIGHQGDDCAVPCFYVGDSGLLEIAVHPVTVDIDQRQGWLVGNGLAAEPQIE